MLAAKLANLDNLTHVISGFTSRAAIDAHCARTGLRLVSVEDRTLYALLDTRTGKIVSDGLTLGDATYAAQRAIDLGKRVIFQPSRITA